MTQFWVDAPTVEIPPPDTWASLSLDQLLDAKSKLINRLYMARGKPAYTVPISKAIARLDGLIASKTAGTGTSIV